MDDTVTLCQSLSLRREVAALLTQQSLVCPLAAEPRRNPQARARLLGQCPTLALWLLHGCCRQPMLSRRWRLHLPAGRKAPLAPLGDMSHGAASSLCDGAGRTSHATPIDRALLNASRPNGTVRQQSSASHIWAVFPGMRCTCGIAKMLGPGIHKERAKPFQDQCA